MLKKVVLSTTKDRRLQKVRGALKSSLLPRVSVFKSNRGLYAQLIDDVKACTLASVSPKDGVKPLELGEKMAQKVLKIGVKKVKFDRGGCRYHGKVRDFCEGLRKGGLEV